MQVISCIVGVASVELLTPFAPPEAQFVARPSMFTLSLQLLKAFGSTYDTRLPENAALESVDK